MSIPSEPALKGRVAVVTGATGGIGKATCRLLASLGCSVGVHFHSDFKTAGDLVLELDDVYGATGAKFGAVKADMGDYEEVVQFYYAMAKNFGGIDILVNNAGTTSGYSGVTSITDVSVEDFEETWRVNCGSAYLLTQLCMPRMEDKGWGRVVFVSSVAGLTGGVVGPHYASSKSALHGLVHWAASAYAKKGITVNGVAPALIADTNMLSGNPEELAEKIPIGRLGTPDEIADTIGWMVKNGYVTNKIVAVDGGMYPQ